MKQRHAVTAVTVQRYRQGSKKVKQQILDEFCETTGYCRGYARYVLVIMGAPQTPYQRVLACPEVSLADKNFATRHFFRLSTGRGCQQ